MRQITFDELKAAQLEILDYVAEFCTKNGLTYALAGGTLIGAIRHKGYIPWDDDIDIVMPRKDYDKFAETFNLQNSRYKFVSFENTPSMGWALSSHVMNVESKLRAAHIDIFPIDNAPDDDRTLKMMVMLQTFLIGMQFSKVQKVFQKPHGGLLRRLKVYCIRIIANMLLVKLWPSHVIPALCIKNAKRFINQPTKRVSVFLTTTPPKVIEREKLETVIDAEFEDRTYKIPVGYDEWLTKVYGDYMTPPPEDQRIPTHDGLFLADDD